LAFLLHLSRGLADRLDHQRDGAARAVEIRDRKRNALAMVIGHDDDELTRLGGAGHQRMTEFKQIGDVRKVLAPDNFKALFARIVQGVNHI
jgi:hypothetical protein